MATVVLKDDDFRSFIESNHKVLVKFGAKWCGPCRTLDPQLERISEEVEGKAKVALLDIDEAEQTAVDHRIMGVPRLVVYKDGQIVDECGMATPESIKEMLLSA